MTRSPSRMGWAVAAVTFGPLIVAMALYFSGIWRPGQSTAHGELFAPGLRMPEVGLVSPGPETDSAAKWQIVNVVRQSCGQDCIKGLVSTRQVRLTLGPDMERVQRLLLLGPDSVVPDAVDGSHPDISTGILADADAIETLVGPDDAPGSIVIVDPLGNLVIRYRNDIPMGELQTDLKRLLKLSRIG